MLARLLDRVEQLRQHSAKGRTVGASRIGRHLGTAFRMDRPGFNPVARVALGHRNGDRFLEVITFGKRPMTFSGQMQSLVDNEEVAYRALFHHHMIVLERFPLGDARGNFIKKQLPMIDQLARNWKHD